MLWFIWVRNRKRKRKQKLRLEGELWVTWFFSKKKMGVFCTCCNSITGWAVSDLVFFKKTGWGVFCRYCIYFRQKWVCGGGGCVQPVPKRGCWVRYWVGGRKKRILFPIRKKIKKRRVSKDLPVNPPHLGFEPTRWLFPTGAKTTRRAQHNYPYSKRVYILPTLIFRLLIEILGFWECDFWVACRKNLTTKTICGGGWFPGERMESASIGYTRAESKNTKGRC